jgi:hypothetical protein
MTNHVFSAVIWSELAEDGNFRAGACPWIPEMANMQQSWSVEVPEKDHDALGALPGDSHGLGHRVCSVSKRGLDSEKRKLGNPKGKGTN